MIEHAVQNHPDAAFPGGLAEGPELLLRAQHGINFPIVRCIITVVGGGLKNGAEVEDGDPHLCQIIQFGGDACQGAAEEVPVLDNPVFVRPPLRDVIPVFMNPAVPDHPRRIRNGEAAEAVGENLIDQPPAEPGRGMVFPVNRQLPGLRLDLPTVALLIQDTTAAVVPPEAKVIPDQFRFRRCGDRDGKASPIPLIAGKGQFYFPLRLVKLQIQNDCTMGKAL